MLRACKLAKPWKTAISTTNKPRQQTTVQLATGSHKHIHVHSSVFRTQDTVNNIHNHILTGQRRSYISLPSSFTALVQQVWEMIESHTKVRKKQRKALKLKLRQNTLTNSMKSIRHNMEFARTRAKNNMKFARTRANLYYNAKVRRQRYLYESTVEHTKQMQVQSKDRWRKWLKQAKGKEIENENDDTASVLLEVEIDDVNGDYKRAWFDEDGFPRTSRDKNGRFVNPWSVVSSTPPFSSFLRWRRERWMDSYAPASLREPQSLEERQQFLPIVTCNSKNKNRNKNNIEFQWIGHSTCLVQMDNFTILTDPVFSNHAAPIPAGVPRFTPPALNLERLQEKQQHIDAVVISHDHYDHLDVHSLREIEDRGLLSERGKYFVPLGHKHYIMRTCGIAADKICELEWWQSSTIQKQEDDSSQHELKISCAPAQHWCSRTPFDRNLRLWCSWAFHSTTLTPTSTSTSTSTSARKVKAKAPEQQPPVVVSTPLLDSHKNYLLSNDASAVQLCMKKLTSSLESSPSVSPSEKQLIASALEILGRQLTASRPVPSPETTRQSLHYFLNQDQPSTFAFMLMRLIVLHKSSSVARNAGVMECLELVSARLTDDSSAAKLSSAPARTMAWCVLSNSFAQSSLVEGMLMKKKDDLIDAALRDLSSSSARKEVKQSVTAFLYNLSLYHSKQSNVSGNDELPDYAIALLCGVLESIENETCETSMFRRLLVAAAFVRCHNEIAGSLLVDLGYHEVLKNSSSQLGGKSSQLAQEIVSMISS